MIKKIKKTIWIWKVQRLIKLYHKTVHLYDRSTRDQFARHIALRNRKIELYAKLRDLDPERILFVE